MIVAGFGFRASATTASLLDALSRATKGERIDRIATASDKSSSSCFQELAKFLSVPISAVAQTELDQAATLTTTEIVRQLRGSGSIAEAAALIAAGPGAMLLEPRAVSKDRMATCALARRIIT